MAYWMVDTRDREAQQVTADADAGNDPRFVKVMADSARAAIEAAVSGLAAAGEFARAKRLEGGR